jgi:hypothetical protein
MKILLTLILIGVASGVFIHENVIFRRLNDFTTTRSKWTISFVLDLKPYGNFIDKLSENINNATIVARNLLSRYHSPEGKGFMKMFLNIEREIKGLNATRNGILKTFTEYKQLHRRSKRSLFPFVGSALGYLFGTVSDADLSSIRRNIHIVAKNEKEIAHVVEDSLSILNVSRVQISENRHVINELVDDLHIVDREIANISVELERQLMELENLVQLYLQMNLIIGEIKDMIQRVMFYLEHFQLQLNMLSLGKLSPSTITPRNLRDLLLDIKTQLPSRLSLPGDPVNDLWYFYRSLTCNTILEDNMILVVIVVPLLDSNGKFEIYKIHNLPIPMSHEKLKSTMVAQYEIEASAIAVNTERTKYVLLTAEELDRCTKPLIGFCSLKSAVYHINLSQLCIMALFMKNDEKVNRTCETMVKSNSVLPRSEYLADGVWVITTHKQLTFSVVCNDKKISSYAIQIAPPLGIINLNNSCSAFSDYLNLLPFYYAESEYHIIGSVMDLMGNYNVSNIRLWEPFNAVLRKVNLTELPKKLKDIEQISMDNLVNRISELGEIEEFYQLPQWMYIIIVLAIVFSGLIGIILYKKWVKHWLTKRESGQGRSEVGSRCEMVSVDSEDVDRRNKETFRPTSTFQDTSTSEENKKMESTIVNVVQRLYPTLDGTLNS